MIPGFLVGSVALVATWVLVQDGVSGRVGEASNVFTALLRRVMSADAAGIGNHAAAGGAGKGALNDYDLKPHRNPGGGGKTPSYT